MSSSRSSRFENLSVFYGKAQALDDVSIHVHEGEFVAIVGLNGAGKTTLFNAVSGLAPHAGDIRRQGQSLRGRTAASIARGGIVQSPEGRELFTEMTVRENLEMGGGRLAEKDRAERSAWLFDLFPILDARAKQNAGTLSGGEQQMLTIARALMMKPDLLILDEPTLGLAPVIMEQISKALERLRRTTPITVLLGEQNVTFALPHADRVYVLEHGRIVWEGAPTASRERSANGTCRDTPQALGAGLRRGRSISRPASAEIISAFCVFSKLCSQENFALDFTAIASPTKLARRTRLRRAAQSAESATVEVVGSTPPAADPRRMVMTDGSEPGEGDKTLWH